ncbi:hypothetical protein CHISP_2816 [Chitinispirillum alkaliphilum]|nr:hypothetical protein CHISP_2816 [Chitinispirillum alkaliphilum]
MALSITIPAAHGENRIDNEQKQPMEMTAMGLNFKAYECDTIDKMHSELSDLKADHQKSISNLQQKIDAELINDTPDESLILRYTTELGSLETTYQQQKTDVLLKYRSLLSKDHFARALREFRTLSSTTSPAAENVQ